MDAETIIAGTTFNPPVPLPELPPSIPWADAVAGFLGTLGAEVTEAIKAGRDLQQDLGTGWPGLKPGGFTAPYHEPDFGQFMASPDLAPPRSQAPEIRPGMHPPTGICNCCVVCQNSGR